MVTTETTTQLLDVLRRDAGRADLAYSKPPEQLTGGFWAELIAVSLERAPEGWPTELVARLMPDEALACKETIVQSAVAASGFATPTVRASGDDSAGLGRAYMVMDRAAGRPLLDGLDGLAALSRAPRLMREIPEQLASAMAALHALDARQVREELTASRYAGATDIAAMLDGLALDAQVHNRPDLERAAKSLIEHQSASAPEVICHGDLHPFNLLIDDAGAVTVLDWSASLVAPRDYDVGFTSLILSEPPLSLPNALRPLVRYVGRRLAARFVRRYQHHASVVIDRASLRHYQAIVCLRALVEVAGWVTADEFDGKAGHPWIVNGKTFAARLSAHTGVTVQPR
jgi:aminoglycoside phosphotransferase (APT) family kinase protein